MQHLLNKQRSHRASDEKGFTLIELLVVIVILGILAAVVVFSVGGITDRGNESACETTAKTILTASEAYYAQEEAWATELDDLSEFAKDLPGGTNTITLKNGKSVVFVPGATAADAPTITKNC